MSATTRRRARKTGWGSGSGIGPYLLFIIAAANACAIAFLFIGQQVTTIAGTYPLIYASYFLLGAAMAAFLRIAALVHKGDWPGPGPEGTGRGGGGWDPRRSIILALILMVVAIILIFTNIYYLTNAPSYLQSGLRDTWQQTMYLAVGVLCTVQSPPLVVSWAGFAAIVQELSDLLFLSGVVAIALSRV